MSNMRGCGEERHLPLASQLANLGDIEMQMPKKPHIIGAVSPTSLQAVIQKRGLVPDAEGNVRVTDDMIAEAKALDLARGTPTLSPEEIKEMEDALPSGLNADEAMVVVVQLSQEMAARLTALENERRQGVVFRVTKMWLPLGKSWRRESS